MKHKKIKMVKVAKGRYVAVSDMTKYIKEEVVKIPSFLLDIYSHDNGGVANAKSIY